jgi:hypothetical protein
MQIEVHKTVAARPPAVFKIVADIMNWPQIIGSVTAIELLTRGRVRVGTRVRLTRIMHGHQMTEDWRWKRSSGRAGCGCSEKVALCITNAISVHADLKIDYSPRTSLPINEFRRRKAPAGESRWLKHPQRPARS